MSKQNTEKKSNAFVRFLKWAFVKNIGLKISALLLSALVWVIVTIL